MKKHLITGITVLLTALIGINGLKAYSIIKTYNNYSIAPNGQVAKTGINSGANNIPVVLVDVQTLNRQNNSSDFTRFRGYFKNYGANGNSTIAVIPIANYVCNTARLLNMQAGTWDIIDFAYSVDGNIYSGWNGSLLIAGE